MARSYSPAQIAIIRSKAAKKAGSVVAAATPTPAPRTSTRPAARTQRPWKARTPKPRTTFARVHETSSDFDRPVTIRLVEDQNWHETTEHVVLNTGEIAAEFALSDIDGMKRGILDAIVDGVVYACLDPYCEDVYASRNLLLAGSVEELEKAYDDACDTI